MRVIVVDDFPTMRQILRSLLEQLDYSSVMECESLDETIAAVHDGVPDLIICDYTIKGGCVGDLLERMSGDFQPKIPTLLMCSDSEKNSALDILTKGADGLLVKPFTLRSLTAKIKKLNVAKRAS